MSLILSFFVFSCQKEATELEPEAISSTVKKEVVFKGLKTKISQGISENFLNQNDKFVENAFKAEFSDNPVSFKDFAGFAKSIIEKYPIITPNQLKKEDLVKIKNDFEGLSESDIVKNKELITNFYKREIQFELLNKVKNFRKTNKNSRIKSVSGIESLPWECWLLLISQPWQIGPTYGATQIAISWSEGIYSHLDYSDTRRDALRHSAWNMYLAIFCAQGVKSYGIWWAQTFTNTYEENGENSDEAHAMDYHNNKVGRNYFEYNWQDSYWNDSNGQDQFTQGLLDKSRRANAHFIFDPNNPPSWLVGYPFLAGMVQQINQTDSNTLVYFSVNNENPCPQIPFTCND